MGRSKDTAAPQAEVSEVLQQRQGGLYVVCRG